MFKTVTLSPTLHKELLSVATELLEINRPKSELGELEYRVRVLTMSNHKPELVFRIPRELKSLTHTTDVIGTVVLDNEVLVDTLETLETNLIVIKLLSHRCIYNQGN